MKFSIIIPAYKDLFLKECIDSILAQTYTNFELIIANDCSPYNVESIVNQYTDSRIIYYKNEKRYGAVDLVKNWNNCLSHATGDYVICMGDDDKLLPNCLSDYFESIKKHPDYDIYHIRTLIIDEESKIIDIQEVRPEYESVYSMIWHYWNKRRQFIGDWLFKTSSLKQRGGYFNAPCGWSSDHLSAFIAATEKGIININKIGFLYRSSKYTISQTNYAFEKVDAWEIVRKWYINFLSSPPQNEIDIIYHHQLVKNLKNFINHQIYDIEIISDLSHHPTHIRKWLKKGKQLGIPHRIVLGLFHTALRKRGFWL